MSYLLLGEKLSHSYSEIIHRKMGFDYSLKELKIEDLQSFVKKKDFSGLNVTIPYKKQIIPFLDEVDTTALKIGAVNTVANVNGRLLGFNTDTFGMEYMIKRAKITIEGKNVLILGSGGTKNTAIYLAQSLGAKSVNFVSRTGQINYENCYELSDVNVIINATPVGMFPNNGQKPLNIKKFDKLEGVVDCVYNPFISELLFDAKDMGVKYSGGLSMLVAQALKAEELWTGQPFSSDDAERIISEIEKSKRNIVLTGMPSSGKSTIAKYLNEKTEMPIIDTDSEIEKVEGITIPEIFARFGEGYFREVETKIIKEVGKKNGFIIATGGGSVLKEENRRALKQNGLIIYLDRDLDKLISDNRPLSQKEGVEKLYKERKPIYYGFADSIIDCNGRIEKAVEEILKL